VGLAPRSTRRLAVLACLATVGCDRVTKHAAVTLLADAQDRSFLADTVRLSYAENTGGFLSLGADLPVERRLVVFTIITGVLLVSLAAAAIHRRWAGARLLGAALIVGGGASNWIDRVAVGSVVDFLNVGIGPVRTGVFNVADVAIMLGVVLLMLASRASHGEIVTSD